MPDLQDLKNGCEDIFYSYNVAAWPEMIMLKKAEGTLPPEGG